MRNITQHAAEGDADREKKNKYIKYTQYMRMEQQTNEQTNKQTKTNFISNEILI